jgi:glucosamine--fructose-6-phosphate aminotransferase (isomerizing)
MIKESLVFSPAPPEETSLKIEVGLPLGCDRCVLPEGYAGAIFINKNGETVCNFCLDYKEPTFLGGEQLIQDLDLKENEQVGVTVSGGKDSLYTWMWLVENLGVDKVVAFNHQKVGLVHPIAEENLGRAKDILGSELIQVRDEEMLPRFRKNLAVFLAKPDPAMVRVALCAGCRVGISGSLFSIGEARGITKFVSAASYLELAPFKAATIKAKGGGDEREGLLVGLAENPLYDHDDNIRVIMLEDDHCHKTQLTGGGSFRLYPNIRYFDFDQYFPNIPSHTEAEVKEKLGWARPERSWHFDCLIEQFKDSFYYGLVGYTETDFNLSAQIRHGLLTREEAVQQLLQAREKVINSRVDIFNLMRQLNVEHLIPQVKGFYQTSPFLSECSCKTSGLRQVEVVSFPQS